MAASLRCFQDAFHLKPQALAAWIFHTQKCTKTTHYGKGHKKRHKAIRTKWPGGPSTPSDYNYLRPGSIVGESKNARAEDSERPEAIYPPIKTKFPPGSWGSVDRKHAWMWHELKSELSSTPTVRNRLDVYLQCQKDADVVALDAFNEHPACLSYRQYVTKTHMIPWTRSNDNDQNSHSINSHGNLDPKLVDDVVSKLEKAITDHFLIENQSVFMSEPTGLDSQKRLKCKLLFRCISDTITSQFWKPCPHLRMCQYDEDVIVRALWHRNNVEREKKEFELKNSNLEELLENISKMDQTIVSALRFSTMLRSHLPLPEVEPSESELCTQAPVPELLYTEDSYGHFHKPWKQISSISAGHKLGDPCEFGLLGFLATDEIKNIEEKYNKNVANQSRLAFGLTGCFTWLAAQAFNQGFSDIVDITYPFVCQTVMSDGQNFSFMKYQLNTLALWQDDKANPLRNLCWYSNEMPLYHSIENGHVRELNDDVMRTLVKMFLVSPVDKGIDLKPTVPYKATDRHLRKDFVPAKPIIEEIIEEEQYIV